MGIKEKLKKKLYYDIVQLKVNLKINLNFQINYHLFLIKESIFQCCDMLIMHTTPIIFNKMVINIIIYYAHSYATNY